MQHLLIKDVSTRIKNRVLIVVFELQDSKKIYLNYVRVKQNTQLEPNELELLINSYIRVEYYKKDDVMFNGKACLHDNAIIKEYWITLQSPIDRLRVINSEKLLPFKKIEEIYFFTKFNKRNVGLALEDGTSLYMSEDKFYTASGFEEFERTYLIGSFVFPTFFEIGELLQNGFLVTTPNKTLKYLGVRYCGEAIEYIIKENNKSKSTTIISKKDSNFDDFRIEDDYGGWERMAFIEGFGGDIDAWNEYDQ